MASFQKYYRTIYRTFGYPLTERTAMSAKTLAAAEKRLDVQIPASLRDYYLVSGRERRFSVCHNRLLAPQEWILDRQRLVFMEENQCVVFWGVSTRSTRSADPDDPPVSQGVNDEPITWHPEHRKCSVFLAVMLHYQAVSGGFPSCGMGSAPDDVSRRLRNGWSYCGEVNRMKAYSRSNQVVCLMPGGGVPFTPAMGVLAGGKTRGDLQAIANDLGVTLA
jgi:hypothetical protein